MPWRVVADGAMVEEVLAVRNGREVTATSIRREGEVVKNELSESMVKRYDDNDAYVRSIVERVAAEVDEETGETTYVPVGKPGEGDAPSSYDAEAADRAAKAEQEAQEAKERAAELERKLAEAEAALAEAQASGGSSEGGSGDAGGDPQDALSNQVGDGPVNWDEVDDYQVLKDAAAAQNIDLPGNAGKEKFREALKAAQEDQAQS